MSDWDIVIDVGFGDSGKGVTVDYLCSGKPGNTLVVRFSGGHQVGHTVQVGDKKHVFSHFGAGTLRGCPTFYSAHTTIFPPGLLEESKLLEGYTPKTFYDPLVMVTTPYDIAFNQAIERFNRHGSCGVGIGATIKRNQAGVALYAKDLAYPWVLNEKLIAIRKYYTELNKTLSVDQTQFYESNLDGYRDSAFIDACAKACRFWNIKQLREIVGNFEHIVCEGSQGIMLDQIHGIHPHMTPSYTTSRNVFEIINKEDITPENINIYYVSRCYQTRHGNGPMSSDVSLELCNGETETNKCNPYQGDFRISELDPALVEYAITSDIAEQPARNITRNLVITCLDQVPKFDPDIFLSKLKYSFNDILFGYSPESRDIKPYKGSLSHRAVRIFNKT